jgi:hypothetical protein
MSVVPPAAKGTTILTGLLGQEVCAQAADVVNKRIAAAMPKTGRRVSARESVRVICLMLISLF